MKKSFIKMMLFLLTIAVGMINLSSCKYDDEDVRNLIEANSVAIKKNSEAIAAIQALINSGSVITNVTTITDGNGGIKVTLSNGDTYKIVNGTDGVDGIDGKDGVDGTDAIVWTIGDDGYWYKNGEKTSYLAKVSGCYPVFEFVQDATDNRYKATVKYRLNPSNAYTANIKKESCYVRKLAVITRAGGDSGLRLDEISDISNGILTAKISTNQFTSVKLDLFALVIVTSDGAEIVSDYAGAEAADSNLLPGYFSVSPSKIVRFTKCNLQVTATEYEDYPGYYDYNKWGFAAHQWDYVGNAAGNTEINNPTSLM